MAKQNKTKQKTSEQSHIPKNKQPPKKSPMIMYI